MRRLLVALAVLAAACGLRADTIYTSDGVYEGTMTDVDGKTVRIESGGKTIEMPKGKILHVVKSSAPAGPDKPGPNKPAPTPEGGKTPKPATPDRPSIFEPPDDKPAGPATVTGSDLKAAKGVVLPIQPLVKPFTRDNADHPDPLVYMVMRGIAGSPTGDVVALRQELDRARGLSHDQKRRAGDKWLTPKDYVRCRERYNELLEEAKRAEQEGKRLISQPQYETRVVRDPRTGRSYTERVMVAQKPRPQDEDRLPPGAVAKLQQAASGWADPVMRSFLQGLVEYKARNWASAEENLRRAVSEQPRVAGYWQAYGMVLLETKGYERALQAFVQMVRLQPDNRDAPIVLQQAIQKVPGTHVGTPIFAEAQRLLKQYEGLPAPSASASKDKSTTWLMPGRTWRVSDNTLPVPPYDRLVFRQAVGVPVGQRTLLVDETIFKNAEEVFVKIGENMFVPASIRNSSASSGPKNLGLVPLTVEGATFTPVISQESIAASRPSQRDPAPPKSDLVRGQSVLVLGLDCMEMMGTQVRQTAGVVEQVLDDGTARLNVKLLPGEAAAPVMARDGQLAGFLAGRTDVKEELGGPDKFIPMHELRTFLEQARRSAGSSGYTRNKRSAEPVQVSGNFFVVLVTASETLK